MKNMWKALLETVRQHKRAAVCSGVGLGAAALIAVIAAIAGHAGAAAVNSGRFLQEDLTRAEWIVMYGEQFGLSNYQRQEAYYSDVDSSSELFSYVQTFVENDILQAAERLNGAEKITAREALIQLAKAFGDSYIGQILKKEAVTDDDRIAFLQQNAGISVETLSDGIRKEQAKELLAAAWEYYLNRPFSNQADIVYRAQTKDFTHISGYRYAGGKLTVADALQTAGGLTQEEAGSITAGTVIVLGANAENPYGIALKVTGTEVEKDAAGYVWTVTEPELDEVVENFHLELSQIADFADFVPEEGVTVLEADAQDVADGRVQSPDGQEEGRFDQAVGANALNQTFLTQNRERLYGVSFNEDKKGKLLKLDLNLTEDKIKVSPIFEQYGAQLDMSKAETYQYAADESGKLISKFESGMEIHGGLTIKDLILNGTIEYQGGALIFDINTGITVQPSLSIKGNVKGKQYKVGTFSVPLGWGFSAKAEIYLCVDFEGELSVKPQLTYTANAKKKKGSGINITGKGTDRFECELSATAKVSAGPDITLRLWNIDLADVYGFAGVGAKAVYYAQTADKVTVDVYGPTLELGAGNKKNTVLSKLGLKLKIKIFDESGAKYPCPFTAKYTYDVLRKKVAAEVGTQPTESTPAESSGSAEESGTPSGGGGIRGDETQGETKGGTGASSSGIAEGIIPEGATYYVAATGKTLTAGERFPEEPAERDRYVEGDYVYVYDYISVYENSGGGISGIGYSDWGVVVRNTVKNKSKYEPWLNRIAQKPVTAMPGTFSGCKNLAEAPVIPDGILEMVDTFGNCTSLTKAPTIPSSVTDMQGTFYGCTSLTKAPTIPSSVTSMSDTFSGCTSLREAPTIPSSVTNMVCTFYGCTSLTKAPTIPSSVTDMQGTFYGCTSLREAPAIPGSVTDMYSTFFGCTSLREAPTIPSSVTNMVCTFYGCTSLTGNLVIHATLRDAYGGCFSGVDFAAQNLTLSGSCSRLEELRKTGKN